MFRTPLFIAALALAAPAVAAEIDTDNGTLSAVYASALASDAAANQAKLVLAHQGYVNVAITGRDDDGRFTGTAWKDGRTVFVAVDLPKPAPVVTN